MPAAVGAVATAIAEGFKLLKTVMDTAESRKMKAAIEAAEKYIQVNTKTGQYEKPVTPAPDGDAWFHARIVVAKPKISVFVNGATEPSLVVNEVTDRTGGSIGLWCNGYGLIANLKIAPAR